jgi:hypothetical protein
MTAGAPPSGGAGVTWGAGVGLVRVADVLARELVLVGLLGRGTERRRGERVDRVAQGRDRGRGQAAVRYHEARLGELVLLTGAEQARAMPVGHLHVRVVDTEGCTWHRSLPGLRLGGRAEDGAFLECVVGECPGFVVVQGLRF